MPVIQRDPYRKKSKMKKKTCLLPPSERLITEVKCLALNIKKNTQATLFYHTAVYAVRQKFSN
jgi:hypothetical protein